jgi:hypothetical protein
VLSIIGVITGTAAAVTVVEIVKRAPREYVDFVKRRASGHRPLIVDAGNLIAAWLTFVDRLPVRPPPVLPAMLGAAVTRSPPIPDGGHPVAVADMGQLAASMGLAQPGDVITIRPGHYKLAEWHPLRADRPGTSQAPITVRADRLGEVIIETNMPEPFNVSAPYWHFENLVMIGGCGDASTCEHAFHIVGHADHTELRNNRFQDYNAQIKINGENGVFPDDGLIEGNTLIDTFARDTPNPITPIDMVGASNWRIRNNVIADFARASGGAPTYGAFAKGAGEGNVFERNAVVCEWHLHPGAGERIGLSLGGGGTGIDYTRDKGHTGLEQLGGIIRDNLIDSCSSDGIYLNKAARSVVEYNTLIDTAGIDVRFVESSATIADNMVDGAIRRRDGATMELLDNDAARLLGLFVDWHPQRAWFRDPADLDLTWRQIPDPALDPTTRPDLCGVPRTALAPIGAFANYAACEASAAN